MSSFLSRAVPRALLQALRPALLLAALSLAGAAHAATDTYDGGAVAGCSFDDPSNTYSCTALSSSHDTSIASGYTVKISNAGTTNIGSTQTLTMAGGANLQFAGGLTLATSNLALTGGTLTVGGKLTLSIGAASPTVNITAGTVNISGSDGAVIHGTVTSAGDLAFYSNMRVTGLVTANSISIDKKIDVVANVQTGTLSLALQSSLTGNVNASGDVSIGNHAAVYGNLTGHNVVLVNACAYISGNAAVNAINIGAQGSVGQTITCTGPGASGSSCVSGKTNSNGNACHHSGGGGGAADLDHILISHPGTALTCEPQAVTVTACADAACSTLYTDPVDVTLTPGGQVVTISGGGPTNATVQQSTAGSVTLSASADEANNASTCANTVANNSSCTMVFADAGFKFGTIANHRAEQVQSFTLRALKAGGNSNVCLPLLTVPQNVNFSCNYTNPSSGFVPVRVNGVPLASDANSSCAAAGATVSMPFDGSGTATATLQYADAGSMTLKATLIPPSGPYTGLVLTGASLPFIAAPSSFKFSVSKDVAGIITNNPAATNETGPVFIGAGQPFQVKLEAINAANAVTVNFGSESPAESYKLAPPVLVAPAGGHTSVVTGTLDAIVKGKGATPVATMSWDEVGIINFAAALANPSGYLNSGMDVTGNVNIGRFIPDHFDTALNGTVPMACPVNPTFGTPCPAPNAGGKFVYAAQPFDLSVKAYNKSGTSTQNYEGLYAKTITLAAFNGAGASGALNQNPPGAPANLTFATIDASHFIKGVATADPPTSPATLPAYQFATAYPATPLTQPTNIWLRATDTDNATSLRGATTNEALVSVVSGRLSVGNSYGPETLPMPVVVQAQYWSGSGWVNNPAYSNATVVALTNNVTFSNCQKNLANSGSNTCAVTFTLANGNLAFAGGTGKFTVAAPGHNGSVDITLSKGGVQAIPYLPSTTGRATFGVFRAGPVVYLREVY
ncbi:DUF6701 domain-containing protein [Rugamonas apoptosis]|uniref:DUF6701 domain-containing protein n=1 Tax=Rugamonas apoptosis TaxID=2758570 RepID=A0A7W2F5K8_9BURK|nr:DUF6701 domain-containing protein [Rugamonas apoptosis]MBA5685439.1 hypothetical protein [Rugamonas apoptosis]